MTDPRTPILRGVNQFDVDFVIPRVGVDIPVGIDPFLLFKSRDSSLVALHDFLLSYFSLGVEAIRKGDVDSARRILDFPEVRELGFGYSMSSKRGSGVGDHLAGLIIDTITGSPAIRERGLRHLEELQLLSVGIGPDRLSDITANILKPFLIAYTQRQCELWDLALTPSVPVHHVLDHGSLGWFDDYFDLPTSPIDQEPILLVPRRIVRSLPWINYDDYVRTEFAAYLRAKRSSRRSTSRISKSDIVAVSRRETDRVDRYVAKKEATADQAQPSAEYLGDADECAQAAALRSMLDSVPPGREAANRYQRVALEILNFLFLPELIDGRMEERTLDGTERRDIIFTNDSDLTFWSYLRQEHSSFLLMFEVKNKETISNQDIAQTATYLGDRLGRLGVIVTRSPVETAQLKKAFSVFNDSNPRKVILFVSDQDLVSMLDMRCEGAEPMRHMQRLYRAFRSSVQ